VVLFAEVDMSFKKGFLFLVVILMVPSILQASENQNQGNGNRLPSIYERFGARLLLDQYRPGFNNLLRAQLGALDSVSLQYADEVSEMLRRERCEIIIHAQNYALSQLYRNQTPNPSPVGGQQQNIFYQQQQNFQVQNQRFQVRQTVVFNQVQQRPQPPQNHVPQGRAENDPEYLRNSRKCPNCGYRFFKNGFGRHFKACNGKK